MRKEHHYRPYSHEEIINGSCWQLYANKFKILHEMDIFLEKCGLTKLMQKAAGNTYLHINLKNNGGQDKRVLLLLMLLLSCFSRVRLCATTLKSHMAGLFILRKVKHISVLWPSSSTTSYLPKRTGNAGPQCRVHKDPQSSSSTGGRLVDNLGVCEQADVLTNCDVFIEKYTVSACEKWIAVTPMTLTNTFRKDIST